MTHTNTEALSDERLAEIVAYVDLMGPNSQPCVPGDVARSMAAELLSRRSASNAGRVEVKSEMHRAASALLNTLWQTVYSGTKTFEENWAEMDRRFPQARWLQEELKASHSLAAEAEPVAQGSCASCNGTGDLGGNPSYGMCPDCDGTGKFPPAPSHSSSVSAEMTELAAEEHLWTTRAALTAARRSDR